MRKPRFKVPLCPKTTPQYTFYARIFEKEMATKMSINYYYGLQVYQLRNKRWWVIHSKHFNKEFQDAKEIADEWVNKINLTPPSQSYPLLPS